MSIKALNPKPVHTKDALVTEKPVHETTVPAAAAEPDPRSLLGNPARTAPASGQSSDVPLALTAAVAAGLPSAIPYTYTPSPYLTDPAKILVNQQAYLDYTGVVTPFMHFMSSNNLKKPGAKQLQHYATTSGVIFEYEGTVYKPGKYVPG